MLSRSERLWLSSIRGQKVVKPEPLPNMWPHILILMSSWVGETTTGDEKNKLDYIYWNSKILDAALVTGATIAIKQKDILPSQPTSPRRAPA